MVHAIALTTAVLIEAMESGGFYATTGVELEDIQYGQDLLTIRVKPEANIAYTIQFWGSKKNDGAGEAGQRKRGPL